MEPLDLETGKLSLSAKSLLLLAAGVCTTGFAVYKVVQQEVEAEASVHRQQMQAYHDQIVAITETIKDSRDDAVRHSNAIEGLKVQMAADREAIRTQLARQRRRSDAIVCEAEVCGGSLVGGKHAEDADRTGNRRGAGEHTVRAHRDPVPARCRHAAHRCDDRLAAGHRLD